MPMVNGVDATYGVRLRSSHEGELWADRRPSSHHRRCKCQLKYVHDLWKSDSNPQNANLPFKCLLYCSSVAKARPKLDISCSPASHACSIAVTIMPTILVRIIPVPRDVPLATVVVTRSFLASRAGIQPRASPDTPSEGPVHAQS